MIKVLLRSIDGTLGRDYISMRERTPYISTPFQFEDRFLERRYVPDGTIHIDGELFHIYTEVYTEKATYIRGRKEGMLRAIDVINAEANKWGDSNLYQIAHAISHVSKILMAIIDFEIGDDGCLRVNS